MLATRAMVDERHVNPPELHRFIAYVVLPASAPVAGAEVAARLASEFPTFAADATAVGDTLINVGRQQLVLMAVDAPLPAECFRDDAHQRAWPGWMEAARAQRAHLIVSHLAAATDTAGAVAAAVLCGMTPALGVNWAANGLFVAPEAWRRAAAAMRPDQLPMPELIRPRWYAGEVAGAQAPGLVTEGLRPFVGREVDHPPTGEPPGAVYERALNLCLYLMRAGPVIKDGDTIGQTPTQRITVRLAERDGVPLYRLGFATASGGG
jgi:hypothetical protein